MPALARFLTVVVFACLSLNAQGEKLRIVTDPWAPYVFEEDGQAKGLDYETTALVFERLGIEVEWQLLPWKRCLAMIESGQADGVLDIFHYAERDSTLLYPSEPLSEVEFVIFYAKARPHAFNSLDDLKDLTVGTSLGYQYSAEFDAATHFRKEPAATQEANFGKLALGRIDLVITDRRVGQRVIDQLKLGEQIGQHSQVVASHRQYLAVRRNAGMDLLVQRFGAELKRFKEEPAYAALSAKYAGAAHDPSAMADQAQKNPTNALQQESGAH